VPDFPGTSRYIDAHPWRYLLAFTAVLFGLGVFLVAVADNPLWLPLVLGGLGGLAEGVRLLFRQKSS
jgi:hypothetical protein